MIAIIGGSGLDSIPGLQAAERVAVTTSWGTPSAPLTAGLMKDVKILFLARHGDNHQIPPHRINYRANIAALREAGVTEVIAVNVVGGIDPQMREGELVVPDQLIDYTWGRAHTFFDGQSGADDAESQLEHIDFTYPFDRQLRQRLLASAARLGQAAHDGATYAVSQGPRLETAAEIRKMARDGCHIVGMTSMPEAALAKEAGLRYASIALVVNPAAGLSGRLITLDEIKGVIERRMPVVVEVLADLCATQ